MKHIEGSEMTYAITAVFAAQNNCWSHPYTYKSKFPYKMGEAVVVPKGKTFYSIVKVIGCEENFPFDPKIDYKYVLFSVNEVLENASSG